MPPIPADKLTDAQKKAIEEFKAARSADISGPFVPLLRSPEVMSRARAMGDYLRFKKLAAAAAERVRDPADARADGHSGANGTRTGRSRCKGG